MYNNNNFSTVTNIIIGSQSDDAELAEEIAVEAKKATKDSQKSDSKIILLVRDITKHNTYFLGNFPSDDADFLRAIVSKNSPSFTTIDHVQITELLISTILMSSGGSNALIVCKNKHNIEFYFAKLVSFPKFKIDHTNKEIMLLGDISAKLLAEELEKLDNYATTEEYKIVAKERIVERLITLPSAPNDQNDQIWPVQPWNPMNPVIPNQPWNPMEPFGPGQPFYYATGPTCNNVSKT